MIKVIEIEPCRSMPLADGTVVAVTSEVPWSSFLHIGRARAKRKAELTN